MSETTSLTHYGRKGMKWGQNIFTEVKNRFIKRRSSRERSEDRKRVDETLRKSISAMNDKDLQDAITRLSRETQLRNLSKKPPSLGTRFANILGKTAVTVTVETMAKRFADKYTSSNAEVDRVKKSFVDTFSRELINEMNKKKDK